MGENKKPFPLEGDAIWCAKVAGQSKIEKIMLPLLVGAGISGLTRMTNAPWLLSLIPPGAHWGLRILDRVFISKKIDFKDSLSWDLSYLLGTAVPYADKIYYAAQEYLPEAYQVLENVIDKL